jgi:nitrate reductase NapD
MAPDGARPTGVKCVEQEAWTSMNISSAIVHIVPARLDEACAHCRKCRGWRFTPAARKERWSSRSRMTIRNRPPTVLRGLHGVPGVAAVAMVYQYCDDESDTEEVAGVKLNRRDFIKANAAAAAISAAGLPGADGGVAAGPRTRSAGTRRRAASAVPAVACWSAPRTAAWWRPRATRKRRSIAA